MLGEVYISPLAVRDADPVVYWDELVTEGKSIGTAPVSLQRELVQTTAQRRFPKTVAKRRKKAVANANRRLSRQLKTLEKELVRLYDSFFAQQTGGKGLKWTPFKQRFTKTLQDGWRQAFLTGYRSGDPMSGQAFFNVSPTPNDRRWIESAVREEVKYLNRLLKEIRVGHLTQARVYQRIRSYVQAIRSGATSGRVLASPGNVVIHWVLDPKAETCPSCRWLAKHRWHKYNLPTTPKAGACRCYANCRCRLVLRPIGKRAYMDLVQSTMTKRVASQTLRAIKDKRYVA